LTVDRRTSSHSSGEPSQDGQADPDANPQARIKCRYSGSAASALTPIHLITAAFSTESAMIERSLERFDLYPSRLLGDSGYGSAEMLGWLVYEHGIEPHVTVFDKSARTDGIFSRDDFTYDHAGDVYRCPDGKVLTTTGALVNDGATMLYVASMRDCDRCALKSRCCPRLHGGCHARSMRGLATWRARSHDRGRGVLHVGSARRLRCCSRTSSAFSSSTVCVYEVQTARATSSSSQPPPRTFERWPS
jgi:hypothetical protein